MKPVDRSEIRASRLQRSWQRLALAGQSIVAGTALVSLVTVTAAAAARPGAQSAALRAGPMLGYSQMTEVAIWVQTIESTSVQIAYWPQGNEAARALTAAVDTAAATANTATLFAEGLAPGTRYDYEVLVAGAPVALPYPTTFTSQELWHWRHDPPAFTIALASCFYVNEEALDRLPPPYGGDFQILEHLCNAAGQLLALLDVQEFIGAMRIRVGAQ